MAKDLYEIADAQLYRDYIKSNRIMYRISDFTYDEELVHVDEITNLLKVSCGAQGLDFKKDVTFLNKQSTEHMHDFIIISNFATEEEIDYAIKLKTNPVIYYVVLNEGEGKI